MADQRSAETIAHEPPTIDPFDVAREHLEGPKRWYATTLAAIHAAQRPAEPELDPEAATVHETHTSYVILLGDRAYKLKKPLSFDFVDLSTRELREANCHREVHLNRRLAPDVYLGVLDVTTAGGEVRDHLVEMVRMPDDRRLSALVRQGRDLSDAIRALAHVVAAFHAGAPRSPAIDAMATQDAVRERWMHDLAELDAHAGNVVSHRAVNRMRMLALRYIAGRGPLFQSRIDAGWIVDGHGDMLADDIFLLDDGPRVLDCIEFDDALRYGDVLADVAFLAMDLEHLGAPDLAATFLAAYSRFSGDDHPRSLEHLYTAHRAVVRAVVACLRHEQGDRAAAPRARRLMELAEAHLDAAQLQFVVVGGLPGTGKSSLATALSDATGYVLFRSDEIRKDLAGLSHCQSARAGYDSGIYTPDMGRKTYTTLVSRAENLLAHGASVVADASWLHERNRRLARAAASRSGAELVEVRCVAPPVVAAWRMQRRTAEGTDPSDATSEIAARMQMDTDPWPGAVAIETTGPDKGIEALLDVLRRPEADRGGPPEDAWRERGRRT